MKYFLTLAAILLGLVTSPLMADDLMVGDPAPKLTVSKWLKGDAVAQFEKDKVYIVEFWASWCGPCRKSIPHLSEIQKKYADKGLVVIGQNISERDPDDAVTFLAEMGDQMSYRVALDDNDKMNNAWMEAAGQDGIPTAFIVDQAGVIAWIGNPLNPKFDSIIDDVVSKKYDLKAAVEKAKNAWLPDVKLGDVAPAFTPGKWLKGEPVKELEKGKIYVIDFWATWCGPCKVSIPHLTDLQKKYADKNVVVIGQSMSERNPEDLEPFMKEMGDKMGYRVAVDDTTGSEIGKMADGWMLASKQDSIPTAFIINAQGLIAYIGNPNDKSFEQILDDVVTGKHDLKKSAATQMAEFEKDRDAKKIDKILRPLITGEKYDELTPKVDELVKTYPNLKPELLTLKLTTQIKTGSKDALTATGNELYDSVKDDSNALAGVAARMANPQMKNRDLDLALKFALRADEIAQSKNADFTDLLASIYFEKGDRAKAIEKESQAILQAEDADQKDYYKEKLKFFEDKSNK